MIIKIGNLELSSEYKSVRETNIIISKDGVKIEEIDSEELEAAIEALEKSCWRP